MAYAGQLLALPAKKLTVGSTTKTYTSQNNFIGGRTVTIVCMNPPATYSWTGRLCGAAGDTPYYPLAWTRSNISIGGTNDDSGRGLNIPNCIIYNKDTFGSIARAVASLESQLDEIDCLVAAVPFPLGEFNDSWMTTSLGATDYTSSRDTLTGVSGFCDNLVKTIDHAGWLGGNVLELTIMTPNRTTLSADQNKSTTGYVNHSKSTSSPRIGRATNFINASKTVRTNAIARFNKIRSVILWHYSNTSIDYYTTNQQNSIRAFNEIVESEVTNAAFVDCGTYNQAAASTGMEAKVREQIISFFEL